MFFRRAVLACCCMVAAALFSGCGDGEKKTADEPVFAVAGIPPVADLARRIAGPDLKVISALPEGRSPHDYVPHPGDLRAISQSKAFLACGMPFENNLTRALRSSPVKIVDTAVAIKRIPLEIECEHDHHDGEAHAHEHGADAQDPHVWLSPENCRLIAAEIEKSFAAVRPDRAAEFHRNRMALDDELAQTDREVKKRLAPYAGRSFFVHHPAFGYFAAATGLKQHGIELGGRETSPARLAEVIREAKEHQAKTIFVQPQFNPAAARSLAQAIGGKAVPLDPLAADVVGNMRRMTDAIVEGFGAK